MNVIVALLLLPVLFLFTAKSTLDCVSVGQGFTHIHAGQHLFGVLTNGSVVRWCGERWEEYPGTDMRKVKSGPSGIWGIDNGNRLYTIVGKRWIQMAEISRDVEPSLPDHVYRISTYSKTSCLLPNQIEPFSPNFQNNYYYRADISCADSSNCFSLGPGYDLFKITKTACPFTDSRIDYQTSMTDIEVTSGGGVFGLNSSGFLSYRANLNRRGSWTLVENSVTFKSVSYSYEHAIIWLVDSNDNALACSWLNGSL